MSLIDKERYAVGRVQFALVANAAAGTLGNWQNNTGGAVWVFAPAIRITAPSTGAATADMGTKSTNTTSDNLLDGVTLNGVAAGTVARTPGTNGGWAHYVGAGEYVTIFGSADTTGLTGTVTFLYSEAA